MDNKRSKITEEHRSEAQALRALWGLEKRISQEAFGEKYDLGGQGNVSHYLNGKSALNLKAAVAFATEIGCSVDEFCPRLAREASLLSQAVQIPDENAFFRENLAQAALVHGEKLFDPEPGYIAFDLLDVHAAAGNGCQASEFPEVISKIHVLESWAKTNINVEDLDRIRVITARGISMHGTIENGDVLFVDSTVRSYDGDGIYIIVIGDGIQVKRLQKIPGNRLAVISDNKQFDSHVYEADQANEIIVCGRVLAAWQVKKFW